LQKQFDNETLKTQIYHIPNRTRIQLAIVQLALYLLHTIYDTGIQKLPVRWQNCVDGGYVEK